MEPSTTERPPAAAEVIVRPNGKPYRPRSTDLLAVEWENDDGRSAGDRYGVIVFGTLDPDRARPVAEEAARHGFLGPSGVVLDGRPGWLRDGFVGGVRLWVHDEVRGRPCVTFPVEDR